jgi:hypothetical protein
MKLIHTDNYGGDYPNEKEVLNLPRLPEKTLQHLADVINKAIGPQASRFTRLNPIITSFSQGSSHETSLVG